MEEWKSLLAFEFFYLFSFLAVEVMFRGYLIYRMEKYLGVYAVLPMLVAYAVIHFGKPLGETIGSIGGAYILGILALKSQNIYGGIFIHIGVALLMEVFAFINS
jgi:membrane protease YdiL (CAAX protease family)